MKRVLLARRTYGFGGVEVIVLDWLKRIDYSTYEVLVCSPKDVFSKKIADAGLKANFVHLSESEVTQIYGRYRPEEGIVDLVKGSFWHFFPIWLRFLRCIKPDAVVFLDGDFFTTPLACVLAAYVVTKGNVSMTIHSPSNLQEPEKKRTKYRFGLPDFGLWWYPRVWWPLLPWKMRARLTNRVLISNRSMKDKVVRFFGYPESKIGLVSHGVDVTTFKPCQATRMRMRREWGIPDDALVIVSTSRLSREKRVDRIVSAFEQIAAQNPSVWLVLSSEGPLKGDIEKIISDSRCGGRIKLLGHAKEIAPVLQGADVYVLASEFEGLPLALMEAMATGLVCLMSNISGPDEMIEDGRNGFLIERSPAGVLAGFQKALALTPQQREKMADSARATIEQKYELEKAIQSAFEQLGLKSANLQPRAPRGSEVSQIQERVVR
jgi:glycosyltransferase involved in cell wall biosynthesis